MSDDWAERAKEIKENQRRYKEMSPMEKIQYNVDNIQKQLDEIAEKEGIHFGCEAGRDYCVECGLSEILNAMEDLKQ